MLVTLNRIGFAICVLSILAMATIGTIMIWAGRPIDFMWRCFGTSSIFFLASAVTLSVSKALVEIKRKV